MANFTEKVKRPAGAKRSGDGSFSMKHKALSFVKATTKNITKRVIFLSKMLDLRPFIGYLLGRLMMRLSDRVLLDFVHRLTLFYSILGLTSPHLSACLPGFLTSFSREVFFCPFGILIYPSIMTLSCIMSY
jgi:hypothetical protein